MENKNEPTEYLGFIIRLSNDPWMVKYQMPFEYFHPDGEGRVYGAASIEDAKECIDERLDRYFENKNEQSKAKIL